MSDQPLQVTPASAWKRQTEIIRLPSGAVVEVQRPSVVDTIMSDGSLPDGMAKVIFDGFFNSSDSQWQPKAEDMPALAELMAKMCRGAFVNPRIVEAGVEPNYDNGEIALADVKDIDRRAILNWVVGGGEVQAVTPFPEKQMAGLESLQNGRKIRHKTR